MGKFRSLAKAAISQIEELRKRADLRIDDAEIEFALCASKCFRFGHRFGERFGSFQQVLALVLIGIGDGEQDAAETGPPPLILRGKIGAAKKPLMALMADW